MGATGRSQIWFYNICEGHRDGNTKDGVNDKENEKRNIGWGVIEGEKKKAASSIAEKGILMKLKHDNNRWESNSECGEQ